MRFRFKTGLLERHMGLLLTLLWMMTSCYSPPMEQFTHRGYLGWMIDMSRSKSLEDWPSVKLDSALIGDYMETLDFLERSGMNEITPWGLFTNKYWEPEIENTIDAHRDSMVRKIIDLAHQRNIKVICGLGVYSWGFDKIISENPGVRCADNPEVMDLSASGSWEWQKKVIDYIMDNFDFDGFSLQSADRGRCNCGQSEEYSEMEYHAILNQKTVKYIRSKKKDMIIGICGWGMNFSQPEDLEHIVSMTKNVDYLIDVGETATFQGNSYRKKLIQAMAPCTYGSTAIPNIEPIQAMPRDYYFVPTVYHTGEGLKKLYNDGGRACEAYVRTRGNPGDMVSGEVIAQLLSNPAKDINAILAEILERVYKPKNDEALATLMEIYKTAEEAFFSSYPKNDNLHQYHNIILLMNRKQKEASLAYIERMSPEGRENYLQLMQSLRAKTSDLLDQVDEPEQLELLARCLTNTCKQ